jgi:ketosteroid isomerase-like protein
MNAKKIVLLLIIIPPLLLSCSRNKDCCKASRKQTDSIIKTDIAFSDMSVKEGNQKAFMYYCSDSAVLFREGSYPIIGRDSLLASFMKRKSTKRTLSWKPTKADISLSNDLGYTIGEWILSIPDSIGKIKEYRGHYFTIWKKQTDGKWKFAVDGGTSLGNK